MKKLTNKKGFTLVELLVVVAIIAILMLLALPRFMDSTQGAKIKTFEGNFRTVMSAIAQYTANNAGSTDGINGADSAVQKLVGTLADKPKNASYTLDGAKFEAKLDKKEIPKADGSGNADADYVITYTFATGNITQTGAPDNAAKLANTTP